MPPFDSLKSAAESAAKKVEAIKPSELKAQLEQVVDKYQDEIDEIAQDTTLSSPDKIPDRIAKYTTLRARIAATKADYIAYMAKLKTPESKKIVQDFLDKLDRLLKLLNGKISALEKRLKADQAAARKAASAAAAAKPAPAKAPIPETPPPEPLPQPESPPPELPPPPEGGPSIEELERLDLAEVIDIGGADNPEIPDLPARIEEAKTLLEQSSKKGKYNAAFYDPKTGEIHVMAEGDPGVKRTKQNGLNSQYEVDGHPDWIVIGNITPNGTYYVPYSPALDTKTVRAEGTKYMAEIITTARDKLRTRKVKSKAIKGKDLADFFSPEFSARILIIEHLDPVPFFKALESGDEAKIKAEYNKVIVVAGLNKGRTYSTNTSPAGAMGFAQFMPDTYEYMVKKYPKAKLEPDFVKGMQNHVNAVMAQHCLFDSDLSGVPEARRKKYVEERDRFEHAMELYLAAAYNGGLGRANRKIETLGEDWREKLPLETKRYLEKLEAIEELQRAHLHPLEPVPGPTPVQEFPEDTEAADRQASEEMYRLSEEAAALEAEALEAEKSAAKPQPHASYLLGIALEKEGKDEESVAELRLAVEAEPKNVDYRYALANVLGKMGRNAEAEPEYREAIALNPKVAEYHFRLGNTLSNQGKYAEAEVAYKAAVDLAATPSADQSEGPAEYRQCLENVRISYLVQKFSKLNYDLNGTLGEEDASREAFAREVAFLCQVHGILAQDIKWEEIFPKDADIDYAGGMRTADIERKNDKVLKKVEEWMNGHKKTSFFFENPSSENPLSETQSALPSLASSPNPPKETLPANPDLLPKLNNHGHVSIVLTGGRRPGSSGGGGLFDSINQLLYDPETNTLAVVEISRDLKIKGTKLNTRTKNNPGLIKKEVAKLTKETVDYHLNLTLESAEQLAGIILETFGPIEVKQDEAIVCQMKRPDGLFYYFPKNPTITTAKELVAYSRFRYGWRVNETYQNNPKRHGRRPKGKEILAHYSSNTHRQLRQSSLMEGIIGRVKNLSAFELAKASLKIPQILAILKSDTNISPEEIGKFIYLAKRLKEDGRIVRISAKDKITAIWEETASVPTKRYKGERLVRPNVYEEAIKKAFAKQEKGEVS